MPRTLRLLLMLGVVTAAVEPLTGAESQITEFAVPSQTYPGAITSGPDGRVWFAEETTHALAAISTLGTIEEYVLPNGTPPDGDVAD
jgi:streptogramin lyase